MIDLSTKKEKEKDIPKLIKVFVTEQEYRNFDAWNQSKIKDWVNLTPFKWRDRYIDETDPFKVTNEMLMGSAIDLWLTQGKEAFDKGVMVSTLEKPLTGNALKLVNALLELCEEGESVASLEEEAFFVLFKKAYDLAGIKSPKVEGWYANFMKDGNEAKTSFIENLYNRDGGIVLTKQELEDVESTVETLQKHHISANITNPNNKAVKGQFGIAYEYRGRRYKALYDFLEKDNFQKLLRGIDLKTNYSPNEFGLFGYLKNRYYFQQGIYEKGLHALVNSGLEEFKDFEVCPDDPFNFLVVDNKGIFEPSMWNFDFTEGDCWSGFRTKTGSYYKGIEEVVEEIEWHMENKNYRTTKEIFDNNHKLNVIL